MDLTKLSQVQHMHNNIDLYFTVFQQNIAHAHKANEKRHTDNLFQSLPGGESNMWNWTMHNYHINYSKEEKIRLPDTFTTTANTSTKEPIDLYDQIS